MRLITLRICAMTVLSLGVSIDAAAQAGSVLRLLPTEDRQLTVDDEGRGALSASDFLAPTNSYLEAWSIEGQPGQSVTIDLASDDFDAYLFVAGPGLTETLYDDDSGGGCNSRITLTFLEAGAFHVVASSTAPSTTGTYILRTWAAAPPAPTYGCGELDPAVLTDLQLGARLLPVGEAVTSRLDGASTRILEGKPIAAWALRGEVGEAVTITMTSRDFDSYVYAYGPGMDRVETDDDGGGDLNAQLTVRFREAGTFIVGASSASSGSTGGYTLLVERALSLTDLPISAEIDVPGSSSGFLGDSDPVVDGRRSQVWTFQGTAGQNVTIDLSSSDFDSYLTVLGPGITAPLEDDDSGGELNSRIALMLQESGTFRIVAAAIGPRIGSFVLSVQSSGPG